MDTYDDSDATEVIQRVWRGFLGRRKSARIQLNNERERMRPKQHKKQHAATKVSTNVRGHTERSSAQSITSGDQRPKVSDVDDSLLYDDQADVTVYKAVKRGTNIGSFERKSNHAPRGGRQSFNANELEDDVLQDSLERLPKQATVDKRIVNPVVSAPSPVYNIDPSLIHSHLSVIDEGDEMVRDSLSSTAAFKFTPRGPLSDHSNEANVTLSPRTAARSNTKSTSKANSNAAVVMDSLDNPPSLRFPPRVERQTSSRTHSGNSRNDNDTVDTEAEEVHTGRRSSEADSIEYGQFIKTDHYDDVIASLGDDYNAWDDLDQHDDVIMEDSLRRSRNFQNNLVLAGMKHANQVVHQQQQRQPQPPTQPHYAEESAIPRFTSRKSSGHLKAFDSDGALSQHVDSSRREPTKDVNTPSRGATKQDAFSPEKPYIPSVRDLLAVSPEPADRNDRGIAHADGFGANAARGAGGAPKSMLSRLEQAQQMYEANVKKNFPITATGVPATSAAQPASVLKESLLNAHLPLRLPPQAVRDTSDPRDYSLSPVPLSGRSRTDSYNSNAERSPRRAPVLLVPSSHQANGSGLRGPSPRLPSYPGSDSPTPSQQSNQGSYQHQQQSQQQQQGGYGAQHAQLSQRGPPSARDSPYQQGYESDQPPVVVPKSIRLAQPVPSEPPYKQSQIPAPSSVQAPPPSLAQPGAQRRPPQFPGQVQPQPQQAPPQPKQATGGYFAAYADSQQTQNRVNPTQQAPASILAPPAALAPVVANRFSNLPSKLIPAAVARPVVKPAPVPVAVAANKNINNNMNNKINNNGNVRPKDMSQTKMTELQEQKLLQEIEDLNRVRLQKLQELARIEQIEKAAAAAAAQQANSPRVPKKVPDPVREKEKRAFKAGAKDVNPTPALVKMKNKAGAAVGGRPQPAGLDEWSGAAQSDQAQSNMPPRNGYLNQAANAPSPTPIQPLLAPPTGADVHGGLNPGGFAAGAGYLQVYKKKQEVGLRGNSNPRGRRGNGEDALSANGDAQSEGMLFNRRAQAKAGAAGGAAGYQQQYNAAYEETASLPAIPSARQARSSSSARPVSGHHLASAAPPPQQGYAPTAPSGYGGGNYYEDELNVPINPQFVHPLDGQNRRVLNASRNNTMSAPSRLLDEGNHRQGGYTNGDGDGVGYSKLPELGKVSHDYGMPSQLPVPIYNMQKKVAPMKGYSKR